jgi:hypothetical protein
MAENTEKISLKCVKVPKSLFYFLTGQDYKLTGKTIRLLWHYLMIQHVTGTDNFVKKKIVFAFKKSQKM